MITFLDWGVFAERFAQAVTARAAGMKAIDCYFLDLNQSTSARAAKAIHDDPFLTNMASLSIKLSLLGGFSCMTGEEASAINDFFDEESFAAVKDADSEVIKDAILKAANLPAFARGLFSRTFPELENDAGKETVKKIEKTLIRHGQEWRTNEPAIDDEHDSFNALVVRLLTVVCGTTDAAVIQASFATLKDHMRSHADAEESFARARDPETAEILVEAHAELFASVNQLAEAIGRAPRAELLNLIGRVGFEIEKHEDEIDVPLFRLLQKRRSAD